MYEKEFQTRMPDDMADALMLRERIWSTEPGFYQIKGESTLDLDLAADTN